MKRTSGVIKFPIAHPRFCLPGQLMQYVQLSGFDMKCTVIYNKNVLTRTSNLHLDWPLGKSVDIVDNESRIEKLAYVGCRRY